MATETKTVCCDCKKTIIEKYLGSNIIYVGDGLLVANYKEGKCPCRATGQDDTLCCLSRKAEYMGNPIPITSSAIKRSKAKATAKIQDVNVVIKAIAGKASLPILNNRVAVIGGKMIATDLDVWFEKQTTLPEGLYSLVGGKKLELSNGDDCYKLEDYPLKPSGVPIYIGRVDREELISNLEIAVTFISKDDDGCLSCCLLHCGKKAKARLVASNGLVLSCSELSTVWNEANGDYLIQYPARVLIALKSIESKVFDIKVVNDEDGIPYWIYFEGEDGRVTTRIKNGCFPDYEGVFREMTLQVVVDKKTLSDAIAQNETYLKEASKKRLGYAVLVVEIRDETMTLHIQGEYPRKIDIPIQTREVSYKPLIGTLIMNMRKDSISVTEGESSYNLFFGINYEYLKKALKGIESSEVYIGLDDKLTGTHLYGADLSEQEAIAFGTPLTYREVPVKKEPESEAEEEYIPF